MIWVWTLVEGGRRILSYLLILFALMMVVTKSDIRIGTWKDKHCKYSVIYAGSCSYGIYTDECGRETCYKGWHDGCGDTPDKILMFGKCMFGMECVCGMCTGCLDENTCSDVQLCKQKVLRFNSSINK